MRRTILVLVLLQVVAADLGAPAVLRVSSHHVVLSASRQPPQGAPQRGVDADPERLLGWWWQGRQSLHPDRWIVVPAAQLAQCCVRWWGPRYRGRPRDPGHDQASNESPAQRRRPTQGAPIARTASPMTTLRDPSPGVLLAAAPLHHRLQRRQAHCRRQVTGTGAVPQQTEI